jgi:hypothetical protein
LLNCIHQEPHYPSELSSSLDELSVNAESGDNKVYKYVQLSKLLLALRHIYGNRKLNKIRKEILEVDHNTSVVFSV